ncbi:MAG: energy-coupling factor transport system ATP-binding protein [Actinomycetota bacterium]|nr:energy-coupling factor transport system ATP-binding protein [Actinomycetota bacterium]
MRGDGRAPGRAAAHRAGPVAVRARGWGWRYATRRAWALRGVDLDVAPGERVLLLGTSGSGKSTLLAGLAGLLDGGHDGTGDDEGTLDLDGVPAVRARHEAVGAGSARTGLLLQDPMAQTVLTRCGDDVAFGLENHAVPRAEIWPRVEEALDAVAFPYGASHPTAALSGGQRQRLALAGVLALRPGLLLLDEPTAMLDPDGAALLRGHVADVLAASGATCVVCEHRVAPWIDLVDRIVVLEAGGGVLADGSPREVLARRGTELAAGGVWVPGHEPGRDPGRQGSRPHDGEPLLAVRGVSVRRRGLAEPAVSGVDLDLSAGRALAVVGPNGAGKSSLALALAGLAAPAAGTVTATARLTGNDLGPHPHRWRPRDLVTRIGTVFQDPQHQFVARTVADELAVSPSRAGVARDEVARRVDDLLERLRLAPLARANPFTLSGGEQRRLSVATALAARPGVLVLDEPTFGQDARTWAELVTLFRDLLDEGTALAVITHDEALTSVLADDVLELRAGRPHRPPSSGSVPVSLPESTGERAR